MTWDYKKHLAEQERYREDVDGVFEACMTALRTQGGPVWLDNLCQADIISTIVKTTRAHDAKEDAR